MPSVIVIEDNFLIAREVGELLETSGFHLIAQCSTYAAALECVDGKHPDLCVLDLDLGGRPRSGFAPGEEGRRLLAVLSSKNIPTVVYSAFTKVQHQLENMHADMLLVDKVESAQKVIDALRELHGRKQS